MGVVTRRKQRRGHRVIFRTSAGRWTVATNWYQGYLASMNIDVQHP